MEERRFINRIYLQSLVPVTLSVLLVQLCSIINNLVVGNLIGSDALAVMSLVSPIGFIFATVGSLLAVGGSIQAAHGIGERNSDVGNKALCLSLITVAIIGITLTVAGYLFTNPILTLFSVSDELREPARNYLITYIPSAVAAMGIYIPFNFLKINGGQRYSVVLFGIMVVCNITLDFLFVKVFSWGMSGVGLATTLANWAAFLPGVFLLFGKKGGFSIAFVKRIGKSLGNIVLSGSPSAVNNFCNFLRTLFLNMLILQALGKSGLSVFSVIATITAFAVALSNGAAMSMTPFAAVFSSERDSESQRQLVFCSMAAGVITMGVFALLVGVFPKEICALFSISDKNTVEIASRAIPMFALSLVFSMINSLLIAFHQSNKHMLVANILTVIRAFAFVVLSAFIFVKAMAYEKIWLSFFIAETATMIAAILMAVICSSKKEGISKFLMIDTSAQKKGKYIAFTVKPDNVAAAEAATKIADFCEQNNLSPKITMAISIAIEEIIVSFNEHAIGTLALKKHCLGSSVRILILDDMIILRFRTNGKIYDPVDAVMHDDDPMSDTLGIKMVQALAKSVAYNRVFGINNLTITI